MKIYTHIVSSLQLSTPISFYQICRELCRKRSPSNVQRPTGVIALEWKTLNNFTLSSWEERRINSSDCQMAQFPLALFSLDVGKVNGKWTLDCRLDTPEWLKKQIAVTNRDFLARYSKWSALHVYIHVSGQDGRFPFCCTRQILASPYHVAARSSWYFLHYLKLRSPISETNFE